MDFANQTRNPLDMMRSFGTMDALQTRDIMKKAGGELVRAYHQNDGMIPGKVLQDVGTRFNLGAQQLGALAKHAKQAGSMGQTQSLMGREVPRHRLGQANKTDLALAKAQQTDTSSSAKKFNELRQQGVPRDKARKIAYGELDEGQDKKQQLDALSKRSDLILNDYDEEMSETWKDVLLRLKSDDISEVEANKKLNTAFNNMRRIAQEGKSPAIRRKASRDLKSLEKLRNDMNKLFGIDSETEEAYDVDTPTGGGEQEMIFNPDTGKIE